MTKWWADSVVSEFRKFVMGLVALALCLGTIGTTLALVDVAPACAAGTPTIISISSDLGPAGRRDQGDDHRDEVSPRRRQTTSSISAPETRRPSAAAPPAGKIIVNPAPAGTGTVSVTVTVSGVARPTP